jgi:hypothetical protein
MSDPGAHPGQSGAVALPIAAGSARDDHRVVPTIVSV